MGCERPVVLADEVPSALGLSKGFRGVVDGVRCDEWRR